MVTIATTIGILLFIFGLAVLFLTARLPSSNTGSGVGAMAMLATITLYFISGGIMVASTIPFGIALYAAGYTFPAILIGGFGFLTIAASLYFWFR